MIKEEEKAHCCSDCDCPETCTKTGCVGMSTERERCEAVARAWLREAGLFEASAQTDTDVRYLGDLIARERAAAREEALEDVDSCKCESLIEQCTKFGKALEASCPVHEWRLVDAVVGARKAAFG